MEWVRQPAGFKKSGIKKDGAHTRDAGAAESELFTLSEEVTNTKYPFHPPCKAQQETKRFY